MDISTLQEFVSIVETCSFQETAARMNISQSSLTKHIHKLEEELNLSLFDRSTRSVRPNEFGRIFYTYARNITQMHADAITALNELAQKDLKQFTVAYDPLLGQYGLVDTISNFARLYPDSSMHTIETYSPMNLLRSRTCHFAFLPEKDLTDDSFNKMIYCTDHLAVVMQDTHPLADRESVSLEDLYGENFILHSSPNETPHEETQKFLDLCASKDFDPNIVAETQFTSTMVRYVSAGRGVAILNRHHVSVVADNIKIVDIYPTIRSYIYMVYPRKLTLPPALDFLHYMIGVVNQ